MRVVLLLLLTTNCVAADRLFPRLHWQFVEPHCGRRNDGSLFQVPAHWHEKGKRCEACSGTPKTSPPSVNPAATRDDIRQILQSWDESITAAVRQSVAELRTEFGRSHASLDRRLTSQSAAIDELRGNRQEPTSPLQDFDWLQAGVSAALAAGGIGVPWWAWVAIRGASRVRRRRRESAAGAEAPAEPFRGAN